MPKPIKINFDAPLIFEPQSYKPLMGIIGLYFLFLSNTKIQYPFDKSRLIYIGMSEKRTNSIGKRLTDHFDGKSGNIGLTNYRALDEMNFTYLNFEMIRNYWPTTIEFLETYFISGFVKTFGVYPICNNKTGPESKENNTNERFLIDWDFFK